MSKVEYISDTVTFFGEIGFLIHTLMHQSSLASVDVTSNLRLFKIEII